jgi:glycosyltransferase involved in cell wall biosynthesis
MSLSALFVTTVPITLEAFLAPFARHFRSQGWRVDALANGATSNERIADAFDHRFDVAWSRNPLSPSNLLGTAAAVRRIVAEGRYDIVHVHTPVAAFATRYALRRRHRADGPRPVVIYTAHGFHFYRGQRSLPHLLYRLLERLAAPWTDYLVTINSEDYAAAQALGGIETGRIRLIPGIGVDTTRFADGAAPDEAVQSLRAELDIPGDAFVLTMVAEFGPVKRHEHLFEALTRVTDPRIVLVLAGDGPLEDRLRARATQLGIEGRVRWAGYRRDVPALLAASDAVALVSEREGLARSLLEGMAAGKAIIGTDTRGIADLALPDAGWIAPKHDAAALASLIDHAAAHPDEVAAKGRAARERAERDYALPHIIRAYEELYNEALASRI